MRTIFPIPSSFMSGLAAMGLLAILAATSGCNQETVHTPAVAELNQKARLMLASGDTDGAIQRLEAARDLSPEEPNTLYNLAIAYGSRGRHDEAIPLLEKLMTEKKGDTARVARSLGLAYEEKADLMMNPVPADEKQPAPVVTEAGKVEAKALYEKAIGALEQAAQADQADSGKIKEYILGIQEKIGKIR